MEIKITKSIAGNSILKYSVRYLVANLPSDEAELITDYQLDSFEIASDGKVKFTLRKLIDEGITYADRDDEKVAAFETEVSKGLDKLEKAAERRRDFFDGQSKTALVAIRRRQAGVGFA